MISLQNWILSPHAADCATHLDLRISVIVRFFALTIPNEWPRLLEGVCFYRITMSREIVKAEKSICLLAHQLVLNVERPFS